MFEFNAFIRLKPSNRISLFGLYGCIWGYFTPSIGQLRRRVIPSYFSIQAASTILRLLPNALAARQAHLFMTEIVHKCTHGIDLQTGAIHRSKLPQIRANLDDPETARLAESYGVPVLLNVNLRDGSLREAAAGAGIPMLLYEAGESLRFNEVAICAGVKGNICVMRSMGMLPASRSRRKGKPEPFVARSSSWVRASASGLFRRVCSLGSRVKRGTVLGLIDDPFGGDETEVYCNSQWNYYRLH